MPAKNEKLGELYVQVSADVSDLKRDFAKIQKEAKAEGGKIGRGLGTGLKAGIASVGLFAAISLQLKNGFQNLRKFDKAMRNVNTIMTVSNKELKVMSKQLREIAQRTGSDATDLADGLYQAASAGIAAADSIQFLETAVKAAKAGLANTETSVDALTTVINAFKYDAEDAGKISDIMFQTVKLGKTTFNELASSLNVAASIAASSGVSFEELSGAVATLTKQGTPTAVAMTQVRATILAMNKTLGDGWTKTMTFNQAAQEMQNRAGGSSNKLREMVGRVEALNGILGVTGRNAKMAGDDFEAMGTSGGAAMAAFNEQALSLDERLKKLSSTWTERWMKVVENALPTIEKIASGMFDLGVALGIFEEDKKKAFSTEEVIAHLRRIDAPLKDITKAQKVLYKEIHAEMRNLSAPLKNIFNDLSDEEDVLRAIKSIQGEINREVDIERGLYKKLAMASDEHRVIIQEQIEDQQEIQALLQGDIGDYKTILGYMEQLKSLRESIQSGGALEPPPAPASAVVDTSSEDKLDKEAYVAEQTEELYKASEERKLRIAQNASDERIAQADKEMQLQSSIYMAGINGISAGFVTMFNDIGRISVESNNTIVKGFVAAANAIVDQLKRILAQYIAIQIAKKVLGGDAMSVLGLQHGGKVTGGEQPRRAQHGASITVPTGFNNDTYPLKIESGETAEITSRGRTSNQEALLGGLINRVEALNTNLISSRGSQRKQEKDIGIKGDISGTAIKLVKDKADKRIQRYR